MYQYVYSMKVGGDEIGIQIKRKAVYKDEQGGMKGGGIEIIRTHREVITDDKVPLIEIIRTHREVISDDKVPLIEIIRRHREVISDDKVPLVQYNIENM